MRKRKPDFRKTEVKVFQRSGVTGSEQREKPTEEQGQGAEPMSSIIEGMTKDLKTLPKRLKTKAEGADTKKLVLLNLPYVLAGYFCNKTAYLWRMAEGSNASDKMMAVMSGMDKMFSNPLPSFL